MLHSVFMLLIFVGTWTAIWAWTVAHQAIILWVYSFLVEQLPPPSAQSGPVYTYVYTVLQFTAANARRSKDAVKTRGTNGTSGLPQSR